MSEPLLEARDATITVDGTAAIERLTLVSAGDRVVVAGDAGALIAALTGVPRSTTRAGRSAAPVADGEDPPGEAYVAGGALLLAGKSVADGAHVASTGMAALDVPIPPAWTAEEYATWRTRLAGVDARQARDLALLALGRFGLEASKRRLVSALPLPERRALALAAAVASGPDVLVADAPLSGLDGASSVFVEKAIEAASAGRRTVVSVDRIDGASAEGALARSASTLVVLRGGELALAGSPRDLFAGARVFVLTVRSNADALRAELADRGIDLRGGPSRFSASLPEGAEPRDILAAARAARAAVVEMAPVIG